MRTASKTEVDPYDSGAPNGWVRTEIGAAEERTSKTSGAAMYNLKLVRVGDRGSTVGYDNIMLEGPGASIGFRKMLGLGVLVDQGDEWAYPEPHELVGIRVWSYWTKPEGEKWARVDIDHGIGGYSITEPQDDTASPSGAPTGDPPPHGDSDYDDIPF